MSTILQGASGPTAHTGLRPALGQPPQRIPPEQSISHEIKRLIRSVEALRTRHEESSVTKEEFDTLVKSLDKLGLGTCSGDAVHRLQPARNGALLTTLERFKEKLQDVSDRIDGAGYTGSDEDGKAVSQLMDEIRVAIVDCQSPALPPSLTGESPPPAPKACFGRDDLIQEVVALAEGLTPVALIGAGGIGKTSIALTVLHHDRVKQRFGENRRFIRCDQFPATVGHLLNRLSKVTGAGIENPEDLALLRPFLSSKEMIIVFDNAESILDPEGTHAAEIYALVEELRELPTLCLCITSRISAIPPECKTIEVPVLSMDAACHAFYHIYGCDKGSNLVNGILEQLDFHPLSITLLATVGYQNKWSSDRLKREWEKRRTSVLRTRHKKSLAAAIELSLTSPMFQEFGPDARSLLEVVAFFPQGVDENNIDWLFSTITDRVDIFDGFCVLSLTYRNNGFITMLAPLRDYLSPKDPRLSPLLCAAKECYFNRLSVDVAPQSTEFKEGRWIASEDVNVEHLLDIFTTIDADSDSVWSTCAKFMEHLCWHKKRLTVLGPKIEGLPDDHSHKPGCLYSLSRLFYLVGNNVDRKRLLIHALRLGIERRDVRGAGITLWDLSDANKKMGLYDEGIHLAKMALELFERLGGIPEQTWSWIGLAQLLQAQGKFDAAEEAVSRAISLTPERGDQFLACKSHQTLGDIYRSKGEIKKAVHHLEVALKMASSFCWRSELFSVHFSLAVLFFDEGRPDDANVHAKSARSYADDDAYDLGQVMELQSLVWFDQDRLEEARSEALCAAEVNRKLGFLRGMERCEKHLELIRTILDARLATSGQLPQKTE